MGSFRDYRSQAADCLAMAQGSTDERMKTFLLTMAQSWMLLAQQAAKNSSTEMGSDPASK